MNIKLDIGLDVHKNSIVVATAAADGSPPQHYGKWGGTNLCSQRGLVKLCQKFGVEKHEVRIAYEAGPTGFVLARRLLQLGYHCIVVAPSEVPSKPGEKVKTDKRDARKLARLLRSGDLEGIHIPDASDEAVRDLCRARTDASEALARCKQQLAMFLLRNGSSYDGKSNWTQSHMNYLRQLRMPHAAQQLVLEEPERSGDRLHGVQPEGRAKRVNTSRPCTPASSASPGSRLSWKRFSRSGTADPSSRH